jgi:hypothetical protein
MKKLLMLPMIVLLGLFVTACESTTKEEQIKGEVIQKAASAKLDKVIVEKKAKKTEEKEVSADADVTLPVELPSMEEEKASE